MADVEKQDGGTSAKRSAASKQRLTPVEKLTDAELQTLRLDDAGLTQFEELRGQVKLSRSDLQSFESEDEAVMSDARLDLLSAARKRLVGDNMALVHFLAPRVMKLREGEAKRKWRSFVTKLQKDAKSV